MGNKAYSTDGVEEANLDDIETKLSAKDRKTLLKERIKKYQEELERLESESEAEDEACEDYEDDDYESDDEDEDGYYPYHY